GRLTEPARLQPSARSQLDDVGAQSFSPVRQGSLSEPSPLTVVEHRVGRPPCRGRVLVGRDRVDRDLMTGELDDGLSETVPRGLAAAAEVKGAGVPAIDQPYERGSQIPGPRRAPVLVGDDTQAVVIEGETEHREHEVGTVLAVEPRGAHDLMPRCVAPHLLLTAELGP